MQYDEFGLGGLKAIRVELDEELRELDINIANLESVLSSVPNSDDHDFLVAAIRRSYLRDLIRTRKVINVRTKEFSGAVTVTILAVKRKYPRQYNP